MEPVTNSFKFLFVQLKILNERNLFEIFIEDFLFRTVSLVSWLLQDLFESLDLSNLPGLVVFSIESLSIQDRLRLFLLLNTWLLLTIVLCLHLAFKLL